MSSITNGWVPNREKTDVNILYCLSGRSQRRVFILGKKEPELSWRLYCCKIKLELRRSLIVEADALELSRRFRYCGRSTGNYRSIFIIKEHALELPRRLNYWGGFTRIIFASPFCEGLSGWILIDGRIGNDRSLDET